MTNFLTATKAAFFNAFLFTFSYAILFQIAMLKSLNFILFSAALLISSVLVLGVNSAHAQDSYDIDDVVISGNKRVDTAAIKSQIKGSFGKVTKEIISDDIKTLYNTGFFDQVSASILRPESQPSRTILKFTLVEKPVVRKILIKGNKEIKEDDLSDVLKLGSSRFLDKTKIEVLTKNATMYYQSKGYFDATFEYAVLPVSDDQVDLTFTVNEGQRYFIKEISIHGLKELDEDDILSLLQTKEHKWWSSWLFSTGRLNQEVLENDKTIIRQYLLDNGFIDGQVGDAIVDKKDGRIKIAFEVTEGAMYKIGKISASGDLIDGDATKTVKGIKSEPGDTFNATQLREDTFKVSDKFTDIGYAYANVVPNTSVNKTNKTVDLDFSVNKGAVVNVNRINIRGNQKTYDNVIRRTLKISEQERYSRTKIKRSQQLLERLGYFEEVNISTEQTENPNIVDLNVNVREGSTGTFTAGAGYSSSDGALFSMRVSENNISGTGRSVNLTGEIGSENENIVLGFLDPRVNDSNFSWGAQLLRTDREFPDFDRRFAGGNTTVGYPLEEVFGEWAQDISASLKYEYLDINIDNVDTASAAPLVIDSQGKSSSSSLTPALIRNTINNPLNPTKGSKQILSLEYAGIGGNEEYYLFEGKNQWYYPLVKTEESGDITFSLRTTLGYGDSLNSGEPLPLFRRYFPGGINSVRGFKNRSLGPKDEDGNEYGGAKELINNSEVIFPLLNSAGIKGVLFYDVGEAFDDNESIQFADLRQAWGFGVRWFSPLGPIRIEFGFPLDRKDGEDGSVPMFSFGAPL
jgi:outer membrane protein insertion porin family